MPFPQVQLFLHVPGLLEEAVRVGAWRGMQDDERLLSFTGTQASMPFLCQVWASMACSNGTRNVYSSACLPYGVINIVYCWLH